MYSCMKRCYQFPAVWLKKSTVVITPTVSLMSDQTSSLQSKGIRAVFLGSAQRDKAVATGVSQGEYEIIFVIPEIEDLCLPWQKYEQP